MYVCLCIDAVIDFPLTHITVGDMVKVSLRVETRMVAGRLVIDVKALTCSKYYLACVPSGFIVKGLSLSRPASACAMIGMFFHDRMCMYIPTCKKC